MRLSQGFCSVGKVDSKMGLKLKIAFVFLAFCLTASQCGLFKNKTTSLPITEFELGQKLFFDPILSKTKTISCATCHKPEFAFADTTAFSVGVNGARTKRNTPSAMNVLSRPYLFWDARSPSLENQALHPIANMGEMGLTIDEAIQRLRSDKNYNQYFSQVYNAKPSAELLARAIASFERSLETADSPFDLYMQGDSNAISNDAKAGHVLFLEKANCFECHFSPDFTGDELRSIGLFDGKQLNDSGRYLITKNIADIGKFKVPGLRNIAATPPYMHNGMFKTLYEVIDYYNSPKQILPGAKYLDSAMKENLFLTEKEKLQLVAFLEALSTPQKNK